jgi:hypothetical protein
MICRILPSQNDLQVAPKRNFLILNMFRIYQPSVSCYRLRSPCTATNLVLACGNQAGAHFVSLRSGWSSFPQHLANSDRGPNLILPPIIPFIVGKCYEQKRKLTESNTILHNKPSSMKQTESERLGRSLSAKSGSGIIPTSRFLHPRPGSRQEFFLGMLPLLLPENSTNSPLPR